ncbi:protein SWEETIE [Selaginella moellendorffii]|uniref:protein SWEETIE n=1 Tax=Selaginella moellendorffii TaxID=88036 RepID=UPI000D1C6CEC|nr:protein SWEETIE [Selaginella moellendorffii]|eukprot:XP_024543648.1 protein SWEETIE [Selaginella moellendorffii]
MGKSGAGSELAKLDVLVAQLESMAASFKLQQHLDPLICFDLLADLIWTIDDESPDRILACQRKCEDALQNLLLLGVRPPVRHLAASAVLELMIKGDSISIYSRASSLQGWLTDNKKGDPSSFIGAAQCLGTLYRSYGPKITSNLGETSTLVAKLMRFQEVSVRQAGIQLLHDALEGCGGIGPWSAYADGLRVILKSGVTDKSAGVKAISAGCLRLFAVTGGPGFGPGALENCASLCLKALEDASQSVQDGFAAALGALVALGLNPQGQIQPKGKGGAPPPPAKVLEGALDKYLVAPFVKGPRHKDFRVGLAMAWVAFLQEMHLCYSKNDFELGAYATQVINLLRSANSQIDPHAQACVLYILRVGIVEQMGEPGQKELMSMLCKQLNLADNSPSMLVVLLRTLSHLLTTLGEVTLSARDALDGALVSSSSHYSVEVRVEAALTLRTLAEVDPTFASNVMSCAVTTLWAVHEAVAVEKGDRLKLQLGALHGQAALLAALLASYPKLLLGLPSRLPLAVLDVGRKLVLQPVRNSLSAASEKEAGWMLISSFVSSLPREELREKERELISLWTAPVSGNIDGMLKQLGGNLAAEISGWSAAVEALTAFVKNYLMAQISPEREGMLIQPVLGYLSGSLSCLSSNVLQQATPPLKPFVDVFIIKVLRAFRTLPAPLSYKNEHTQLLRICTAPFREPSSYGESSSLRLLLDARDASLGPWLPGRDSFQDEMRAFEGGGDGLLPCVWEEVPAFPQPVPMETTLVDEMMLCLGTLFGTQSETTRLQVLDVMEMSIKNGKKPSYDASLTNICVALLGSLKKSVAQRIQEHPEGEVLKRIQTLFEDILSEETSATTHRRAAAEGLGLLAKMGTDVYAARLMRSLLSDVGAANESLHKGSVAFVLGCIHRSVGGMALSALVPATVQAICSMARDAKEGHHVWILHGLWLTIESAGLSFVPHVQATLTLVMDIILSEDHNHPEIRESIGRVVNAIVAVLGPELSFGSSLYSRCKSVVSVVSSGEEPGALLEGVRYIQQLVVFAPQALPVHAHVETLLPTLFSKQPSLRHAAVSTLRHLCERDPVAMNNERIEEDLFAMLDTETDSKIIKTVRLTLQRLLDSACPSYPSRWIQICRTVVLASSKPNVSSSNAIGGAEEPVGEDDEGSMIGSRNSEPAKSEVRREVDLLPRYTTRVFAAECLSRIPTAVGADPLHFDINQARQHLARNPGADLLVLHLGELVALAYQVATGAMESIRTIGVGLLDTILEKFGKTEDPDPEYAGHLLLEQYQAQFLSAVRTALEPSASPLLMASGARLAARIVTSGVAGNDRGVLQRVLNLISRPLSNWDSLNYTSYAEWVCCKVKAGLLGAHAAVKTYALACLKSGPEKAVVGNLLISLLGNHVNLLNRCWIGLLKDYTMVCTQFSGKMQQNYKPFLEGMESPAIAAKLQPHLHEVSSLILEAVAVDAVPASNALPIELSTLKPVELNNSDFLLIWALSVLILLNKGSKVSDRSHHARSFPSFSGRIMGNSPAGNANLQLVALRALRCLCSPSFYSPAMLSIDLCQELLSMLLNPSFQAYSWAPMAIVCVVEQIVNSTPETYLHNEDLVVTIVDISMSYCSDLLASEENRWDTFESDAVVCCALSTLGNLVARLNSKMQGDLIPQLLCAGLKLLSLRGLSGNALSSVTTLVTCLTTAASKTDESYVEYFPVEDRCAVLSASVESLASMCEKQWNSKSLDQNTIQHVQILLGILVAVTRTVPDSDATRSLKSSAQKCCIDSLRAALATNNPLVQLAVVQTLSATVQAGITEQPKASKCSWALLLMRELGADVACIVEALPKGTLSSAQTNAVVESLKLLVQLRSLVEGDDAQREVLHVLLMAIVQATTLATSFTSVAVKLVTQLASVPASATQFKAVLLDLPPEARGKLQEIIRTSVTQDARASPPVPGPIKMPVAMKPLPAVIAKPASPPPVPAPESPSSNDEWDDFQ